MKVASPVLNGGDEETYPQGNAPCPYPTMGWWKHDQEKSDEVFLTLSPMCYEDREGASWTLHP